MGTTTSRSASERLWRLVDSGDNLQLIVETLSLIDENGIEWRHPRYGTTALMVAAALGNQPIVLQLLNAGAHLNTRDKTPMAYTALHYAVLKDRVHIVQLLLGRGADVFQQNTRGHSALDISRFSNSAKCAYFLSELLLSLKGWIYFPEKSRFIGKTIWHRRWCMVQRSGLAGDQIEIAIMKKENSYKPTKVVLFDPQMHTPISFIEPHWNDERKMSTLTFNHPLEVFKYEYLGFTRNSWTPRVNLNPKPKLVNVKLTIEGGRSAMLSWLSLLSGPGRVTESTSRTRLSTGMIQPVTRPIRLDRASDGCILFSPPPLRSDINYPESTTNRSTVDCAFSEIQVKEENRIEAESQKNISVIPEVNFSDTPQIENTIPNGDICVICMDSSRDAVTIPCGHLACCFSCAKHLVEERRNCSICRASIHSVMRIYQV